MTLPPKQHNPQKQKKLTGSFETVENVRVLNCVLVSGRMLGQRTVNATPGCVNEGSACTTREAIILFSLALAPPGRRAAHKAGRSSAESSPREPDGERTELAVWICRPQTERELVCTLLILEDMRRRQREEEAASAVMEGNLGCFSKGLGLLTFMAADVIKIGCGGQTWHRTLMAAPGRLEKKGYTFKASLGHREIRRGRGRE